MKYFITEEERKASVSTCHFEFMKGRYHDKYWLPDSISISDELWDEVGLSKLFSDVIEGFAYFGITAVNKHQWGKIVKNSKGDDPIIEDIIAELIPWVKDCFKEYEVFRDYPPICVNLQCGVE